MTARDIMTTRFDYLRPDATLREAVNLMKAAKGGAAASGVKALMVLDSESRVSGIISMGDILKAVFPKYMAVMELGDFTWDGMVEDIARKAGGRKVSEVMTRDVVTVEEDAPLMECVDHMLKNGVKKLPVLGKDGSVAGIIYERDLFFAITRAMLEDEGGRT
ncbi:MAG: CBS domain-containing protein [Nitrospirae bacterium]|nr:CBS domain-containing protein [Nitrospirota bacterium]MBI5696121.1 CBS domain-containing protein [Nitrospirota bacterium]